MKHVRSKGEARVQVLQERQGPCRTDVEEKQEGRDVESEAGLFSLP